MKKITVSIDDELHRRVRIRAAERGTSLSAVVREILTAFAAEETDFQRRKRLERERLESIRGFRAYDRLTREAVHDRARVEKPEACYGFQPQRANDRLVSDETVERLRGSERRVSLPPGGRAARGQCAD